MAVLSTAAPTLSGLASQPARLLAQAGTGPFGHVDWGRAFLPDTPLLEIFVRGTCIYLGLFFLLRFILRRESGTLGVTDVLVIVLIADAAQNGMADNYTSITDGVILVAVIIGWSWVLDALSFRFRWVERVIRPSALPLVHDGRLLRRNLRRELVTDDELASQLREQGVQDVREVRAAHMEPDGRISVVTRDGDRHEPPASDGMR
ncbi:MAG TPA: YetF domain-containing protein [Motilibacteraceae bacterium]|nr:YetF domain-containing protein [Motilibacteraceae bacterium]